MRLDCKTKANIRSTFGKGKDEAESFINTVEGLQWNTVDANLEADLMKKEKQGVYSIKPNREDRIVVLKNIGQGPKNVDCCFFRQTKHSGSDKEYQNALDEAGDEFKRIKRIFGTQATFEPQDTQQLAALQQQQTAQQQQTQQTPDIDDRTLAGYQQVLTSLYGELGAINQCAPDFSEKERLDEVKRLVETYFPPEQTGKKNLSAYQGILADAELSKDMTDPELRGTVSALISHAQENPTDHLGLQQTLMSHLPFFKSQNATQDAAKQPQLSILELAQRSGKLDLKR
ncbi:MAG: hypothetical protein IKS41_06945 [Alphaproteobacteria bacterium]|nr:hypothetical protein [Alphaproteobacteria bacterium]